MGFLGAVAPIHFFPQKSPYGFAVKGPDFARPLTHMITFRKFGAHIEATFSLTKIAYGVLGAENGSSAAEAGPIKCKENVNLHFIYIQIYYKLM